jgi:single-strand DNA-binding protein
LSRPAPCRFCFGLRPLCEFWVLAKKGIAGQNPKRIGNNKTAPVRLSVATTERWRDEAGKKVERTEWHTVLFWNRVGEVALQFVKKGSHILVTGSLKSRQYEVEGSRCTVWEIHARDLLLLDSSTARVHDDADHTDAPTSDQAASPG